MVAAKKVHVGLVGLGKMGNNMRGRMRKAGLTVTGYDPNPAVTDVPDLVALAAKLPAPRIVWVMVPSGPITTSVITDLAGVLGKGDLVIDGGNSRFTDDTIHAALLAEKGIRFADCGVSGGIWGLKNGYGLMAGGDKRDIARAMPLFDALRPAGPRAEGFVHAGTTGAGHYAKMVHNGIEYGLLQAFAEGFHLLHAADFEYDLAGVSKLWNHGSVVRGWLLELAERAFEHDGSLESLQGYVDDSGEGRWTVMEAVERAVPAPVITEALYARFASRDDNAFSMRFIAALRNEFGGHAVKPSE